MSPDLHPHRSGVDLAEHVSLLRRRKAVFLVCLLTGVLGGVTLLRLTPPSYTATTQVLVAATGVQEQPNQVTGRQREALNLDTEAQVAQSAVVAAKAATLLKVTPSPPEVTVPPNSSVLSIAVTEATPAKAAAQSRAYAEAYLAHRTETAQAALATQLKTLLAKLKQVNTSLGKVVEELSELRRGTAEHTIAAQRQNVLSRQVYSLTMKYDALKTVAVTPGYVISQAAEPTAPSAPSLPLYLGSGLMLGLLTGAAAAYGRDRLDTRLRGSDDVERLTGLPVLADLSGPADPATMHDLASSVVAGCPGSHLLVRAVPSSMGTAAVEPLAGRTSVQVLDGSDVGDLARAEGALLVIGVPAARAGDVALAVRRLERHGVQIIGAVTVAADHTSTAPARAGSAALGVTSSPARARTRSQGGSAGDVLGGTVPAAFGAAGAPVSADPAPADPVPVDPVQACPVPAGSTGPGGSTVTGSADFGRTADSTGSTGSMGAAGAGSAGSGLGRSGEALGRQVNGVSPVTGDVLSSRRTAALSPGRPDSPLGRAAHEHVNGGRRTEAAETSPIPQVSDT
ncbi:Wzz/FepE/Etk N-terminal domain-containing protein [Nonomuraea africana]|uniref:Wzz/FepE/Etk N-terminal domain-containing protein n=1 Tax=Nonomuraea africana TaxID=46171 RepID=UPI0033C5DAC8